MVELSGISSLLAKLQSRFEDSKPSSRRQLVKGAAAAAVGAAALGQIAFPEKEASEPPKSVQSKASVETKVASEVKPTEKPQELEQKKKEQPLVELATATPVTTPIAEKEYPPAIRKTKYMSPEEVHLYLSGRPEQRSFDNRLLDDGQQMLDEKVAGYMKQDGIEKQIKKVEGHLGIIDSSCNAMNDFYDPRVKSLLPGLIFVETKGESKGTVKNPNTKGSPNEVRGLCQIKVATADQAYDVLKKQNPKLAEQVAWKSEKLQDGTTRKFIDLSDDRTNVILSSVHLNKLLKLYPDPGMALWSYHFGEGNIVDVLEKYVESCFGSSTLKDSTTQKDIHMEVQYASRFINHYDLSFLGVLDWFKKHFKEIGYTEARLDQTVDYTLRAAAGSWLVRNYDRARLMKAAA